MTNYKNKKINLESLDINTKMLHGGVQRSNFGETSEAIFLNSGFCYNLLKLLKVDLMVKILVLYIRDISIQL